MKYNFSKHRDLFYYPYYKIDDRIIVDDFIRFETLESDLQRICAKLGMKYDSKYLLHYKKKKEKDMNISKEAIEKIREMFDTEIKDLNY